MELKRPERSLPYRNVNALTLEAWNAGTIPNIPYGRGFCKSLQPLRAQRVSPGSAP